MPGRKIPIVTQEIYHIFNRGINGQTIFEGKRSYDRFFETMVYYRNANPFISFSRHLSLPKDKKIPIPEKDHMVGIIAFCLMPNHFHLLLKQLSDNGIAKYTGNLSNSYTKYFNKKNKRLGPIFQGKFKSVRVEDNEQLLHVIRYIHLNPYTSYVIKNIDEIFSYPYSSLCLYLDKKDKLLTNKKQILDQFRTKESFKEFIRNQADYQRNLQYIRHLALESV